MKKSLLKSLFTKGSYDCDSPEYIKKCIALIKETDKYNIYQEHESKKKKNFLDQFRKLLDK